MKPPPFEYVDPRTVAETLERLATHGDDAKILAGGQSLLPMLNLRLARPAVIVDVNRVAGLDGLTTENGRLRVGALVRQRALERWAASHAPLLAAALRLVGHIAIRNRGTVAGSIAHADPASELPALLLCLDGVVVAESRRGRREIAAHALFEGPLVTALAADELITETRFELPHAGEGWGFHEVARRHGDFALVGVAAVIAREGGRVGRARVSVFGAGPTPLRAEAAERALLGREPTPTQVAEAAAAGAAALAPVADLHASADYRRRVARTLLGRALTDAAARSRP
ncbi:MAG TPA: FAD binding domain-containing protein [Methylomirabilota bacterium]